MTQSAGKFTMLFLSLVLIMGFFPQTATADPIIYIQPAIPQNQTQTNNFVIDMVGSPTNTIPSNTAGYLFDTYVQNQNAIRDSYLSTARSYESAAANGSQKAIQRMANAEEAASAANMKATGANAAGKALSVYCIGKDVYEYTNPTSNKHSSLAFIEQTLRGYSIVASSLDTAGVKIAKPLAIGSGLLKDAVGSNTFANWANSQDNVALDFADYCMDGVNDSTTYAFSFYMNLFNSTDDAVVSGRPPYRTGVYKPNIYLYPAHDTKITVSFDLPALLTNTIPQYRQQWEVIASPDGDLTDTTSGNVYGYLFYESETDPALFTYNSGWIICSDTRETQFRDILAEYGFNERESNEFIEFWARKLEPGIDYVMYPQLTGAIDSAMPITVSPKPDNIFRLWCAFKPYNGEIPETPGIKPINRQGYYLVEWGGFIVR